MAPVAYVQRPTPVDLKARNRWTIDEPMPPPPPEAAVHLISYALSVQCFSVNVEKPAPGLIEDETPAD